METPSSLQGWFDVDKIEKVIFNLVSNAFKYTPHRGKIEVTLAFEIRNGVNNLKLEVTNSGKGISKAKLDGLFNRFFLADETTVVGSNTFRTGIGLAYVKKIISVLRGEIYVTSKPNKLTRFLIFLPCDKIAFEKEELQNEKEKILISNHLRNNIDVHSEESNGMLNKIDLLEERIDTRKKVLLVEDEKEIQHFLNDLLAQKYQILIANNGLEALELLKTNIPDIVITDVMMPKMDGIALCKNIKENVKTCHIPIIILTAKSSIEHKIEGIESGANDYISKPFYPKHILLKVENLLEEREFLLKHLKQDTFLDNLTGLPILDDDKVFINKVMRLIHDNIENENMKSVFLEKELGMSKSQLYRKIKELFDLSPGDLIRTVKLKHAAALLKTNSLTVSEVSYRSGFNNRSYFYREFKKMFKLTPKDYQIQNKE